MSDTDAPTDTNSDTPAATPATPDASTPTVSQPRDVVSRTIFSSDSVRRLTRDDFNLSSNDLITLKEQDCILVLFYAENTESQQLVNIWALAAQQVAGPVFAAVNVLTERPVAEAFMKLKGTGNHSLHWAGLRQLPFILVYRGGYPAAFYNGSREVQSIIDYSLTLACNAGYYEHEQLPGSMQADNRVEMDMPGIYGPGDPTIPVRTTSVDFVTSAPVRRFSATSVLRPVTVTPSAPPAPSAVEDTGTVPTVAPTAT